MTLYLADFDNECSRCGTKPCVAAHDAERTGTAVHFTELCGCCFFHDRAMVDPELWNDPREATE